MIAQVFAGWPLSDIKDMTPRERKNWIELAKENGRAVRKKNG